MFAVGEIDAHLRRDPSVLCEDNFNNGPQGWAPLMSAATPAGVITLDSEITWGDSRYSLHLQTGEARDDGLNAWRGSHALKRLYYPQTAEKVYMEYRWAFGTEYKYDSPRCVEFILDACDAAAVRHFYRTRWLNFDNVSMTNVGRYEVLHNGTWTPLPGIVYPHAQNENKRNLWHTEVVYDLAAGCYDGLRINGIGYGSLAETPDATLRAYTPSTESLPSFEGGFNAMFGIYNSNINEVTHSWANLAYQRTVIV